MDEKRNILSKLGSAILPQPGLEDLLAMSSHASGYKRENAVRRIGMLGNPAALPYLIVRTNDWVPQVRAAARDALRKLLRAGNGEAFVASLPAIMHLQTCTRDDHRELMQAVQDYLLHEENVPHLIAGLNSRDAQIARLATRLLVEHRRVPATALVTTGLSHKDVVVRSIVIDLLRGLDEGAFSEAVAKALRDSYMPVRREAFQQLLARNVEAGLRVARDMLFDRSASIREIAVRRLLNAGEPVEQIYAGALTGDGDRVSVVTCVLWSWAFMNSQVRSEQARQLLYGASPAVRRSALLTIAKLLRSDAGPDLEVALADESPAVCKEAARLITRLEDRPSAERLISIAGASGPRHVAIACCRVARHGSKWGWLKFILKVYGAPDSAVSHETFSTEIDVWEARFNRSNAQPDAGLLQEIVSALRICEAKLSVNQLRLLMFTLRGNGAVLSCDL
jgi:HEAT repeat protein